MIYKLRLLLHSRPLYHPNMKYTHTRELWPNSTPSIRFCKKMKRSRCRGFVQVSLPSSQKTFLHARSQGLRRCLPKFLGEQLRGLEEGLRQRDQRGLFQLIKSVSIEDTREVMVCSTSVTNRTGCCETQGLSSEGGRGSSAPFSTRNLTS